MTILGSFRALRGQIWAKSENKNDIHNPCNQVIPYIYILMPKWKDDFWRVSSTSFFVTFDRSIFTKIMSIRRNKDDSSL